MVDIVVTGHPYSYFDSFFSFDPFGAGAMFWSIPDYAGSLAQALAARGQTAQPSNVSIQKTDKTPAVTVVSGPNEEIVVTGKRIDNVTALISHVSGYASIASEMQEWHDNNATWKIVFLNTSDFNAAAKAAGINKTAADIRLFTNYTPDGNHVKANSTVTTYALTSEGTGSDLSHDLVHELLHFTRTSSGAFVFPNTPAGESQILNLEDPVYRAIYHGKTVELDGSATNSLAINAPAANSLIYGTNGNNVISTSGGNNTLVSYNSNDFMIGGTGNDTYNILGKGVKVIRDSGGNNNVYVAWAQKAPSDFAVKLDGSTLYLAPASDGVAADLSPNRLVLENYTTSAFPTIGFTNAAGVRTFVRTSTLTGTGDSGGGHRIVLGPTTSLVAELDDSAPINVVGAPIDDFVDPFFHNSQAAQLVEQISGFGPRSAFSAVMTAAADGAHMVPLAIARREQFLLQ